MNMPQLHSSLMQKRASSDAIADGGIDKTAVATAFSRAAGNYDELAVFQQSTAERLLAELERFEDFVCNPARILDLGAGTGTMGGALQERFGAAMVVSLDIAFGMCDALRSRLGLFPVVADFDAVPLVAASIDLMVANLAVQWSENSRRLVEQCHEVLKPGGVFAFNTLVTGSMREIDRAWAGVDTDQHSLNFVDNEHWRELLSDKFDLLEYRIENIVDHHRSVAGLLNSVKGIGASNHLKGRSARTLTRANYHAFTTALERETRLSAITGASNVCIESDSKPNSAGEKKFGAQFGLSYAVLTVVCRKKQ